jgi:SSS family solute:Na+ symporter
MVKPLNNDFPITGFLVANLLAGMFYWCMDQTNVQRVLGARTLQDGQRGAIFAGFLKLMVPFILVLPGLIARVLYPALPRYDGAYPKLVQGLLPVGLRGLVLAGLIAILMSSMSACYNSSATLVVRDFVLRFRPATPERQQVVIGRWVTVLMAALGDHLVLPSIHLGLPFRAHVCGDFHRFDVEEGQHEGSYRRSGGGVFGGAGLLS